MPLSRTLAPFLVAAASFFGLSQSAFAQSKEECATAYDDSQASRSAGRLQETQVLLQLCAAERCPDFIRADCLSWLEAVKKEQPTISLLVKNSAGNPVAVDTVWLDGKPNVALAEGKSVTVDPGTHLLRVVTTQKDERSLRFSAVQGTNDQVLTVSLEPDEATSATEGAKQSSLGAAFWVSAVSAGALLGTSAILGAVTASDLSHLEETCAPHCSSDQVNSIETRFLIADISLVGGLVASGLATYFWFYPSRNRGSLAVQVKPTLSGAHVALQF